MNTLFCFYVLHLLTKFILVNLKVFCGNSFASSFVFSLSAVIVLKLLNKNYHMRWKTFFYSAAIFMLPISFW